MSEAAYSGTQAGEHRSFYVKSGSGKRFATWQKDLLTVATRSSRAAMQVYNPLSCTALYWHFGGQMIVPTLPD